MTEAQPPAEDPQRPQEVRSAFRLADAVGGFGVTCLIGVVGALGGAALAAEIGDRIDDVTSWRLSATYVEVVRGACAGFAAAAALVYVAARIERRPIGFQVGVLAVLAFAIGIGSLIALRWLLSL